MDYKAILNELFEIRSKKSYKRAVASARGQTEKVHELCLEIQEIERKIREVSQIVNSQREVTFQQIPWR